MKSIIAIELKAISKACIISQYRTESLRELVCNAFKKSKKKK